MSAYMTPSEIVARGDEVQRELERLLARPRVAKRARSRQWAFLRQCLTVVRSGVSEDFACNHAQALQYKYEVEDKLQRYYLSRGEPVSFIFRLMHRAKAVDLHVADDTYPTANGYVLLVTDVTDRGAGPPALDPRSTRDVLERVVAESTDAEWAVYTRLPEVDLQPLDRAFLRDGPAYKRIQFLAERHRDRQWTISQPGNNPSTKRLIDVKVVKVDDDEAWVHTKEYWYLRWWSLKSGDFAQVDYRETNTQKYILVRRGGQWLVESNIYPPPRASTPHRKRIVVG